MTPRELETLRWTMEGKTAWEVGNLLGISERTAALHVNNATHKLDCVNKHQAVLKALRLGPDPLATARASCSGRAEPLTHHPSAAPLHPILSE